MHLLSNKSKKALTPFRNPRFLTGFTLIELLIVISVIALISSIVAVSVRDARLKAKDRGIQQGLLSVFKAAELQLKTVEDYEVVCDDSNNTLSNAGDFKRIEDFIMQNNTNRPVKCYESADNKAYAVSSPIFYYGTHWCIDSRGVFKGIANEIISSQCP